MGTQRVPGASQVTAVSVERESNLMQISMPALLLRLEGAAMLIAATLLYWQIDSSWLLFALLLFAPDLSMLGYLAGQRVGTMSYNLAHTTVLAVALAVVGVLVKHDLATSVGLVWLAHIGLDRMVGYGLKYAEGFKETHLGRV